MMQYAGILLIIDAQEGFITPCSAHVLPLLSELQHRFGHVVFSAFHNPDASPFRNILDYQKMTPGDPDTRLAILPREDAVIIDRPYYTCVTPELLRHLEKLQAREVYIGGIATEACVLKTALDLFEHGICPIVLEDACASDQDAHYHEAALELMAKLVGKEHVITTAALRVAA